MKDISIRDFERKILELYLSRPKTSPRCIVAGTFGISDPAKNKLFNQVVLENKEFAKVKYYLGFSDRKTIIPTGINFCI